MITSIEVLLQLSHATGSRPSGFDLSKELNSASVAPPIRVDNSQGHVVFFAGKAPPFDGADELHEAFSRALADSFMRAALWLRSHFSTASETIRRSGFSISFLLYAWIDQDQFDLVLPPDLLLILGELKIPVKVITND